MNHQINDIVFLNYLKRRNFISIGNILITQAYFRASVIDLHIFLVHSIDISHKDIFNATIFKRGNSVKRRSELLFLKKITCVSVASMTLHVSKFFFVAEVKRQSGVVYNKRDFFFLPWLQTQGNTFILFSLTFFRLKLQQIAYLSCCFNRFFF